MKARFIYPVVAMLFCLFALAARPAGAALPAEDGYWRLLSSRYQASSENYADALLEEMGVFYSMYPRTAHGDSLEWMSGVMYESLKNEPLALASYLKLCYVYPASPLAAQAHERLNALANSRKRGITALFSDDRMEVLQDHVRRVLESGFDTQGGEHGYFDFLLLLADAGVKDMAGYTITQARHYLYRADYNWRSARVCVIIGDMQQLLKKWRSSLLAYRGAELLEPGTEDVGLALLRAGEVYLGPLQNYDMARRTFTEVLDQLPASMDAAQASLAIARVDLAEKKPQQAVLQLDDSAARFPYPEIKISAWEQTAGIFIGELKDANRAAEYYEKIVQNYPTEPGAEQALVSLGKLHEEATKDAARAIDAYMRLAQMFPSSPLAPKYLYRAAELAGDKLKDREKAAALYQQVAANYPDTDEGKKAAKK